ncbi:MAG: hypothetical protein CMD02_01480 [Flavobacteriales bacterium]|nr:hypothetical protein [Flavobacteriales bacterium]
MRYQNPQFLYFLFAIAVPIIIHLFNLRKHKTVYFSSILFLKEVKSEKRKKNKLKQLLILFSRILTISAIVFAFAKPFIPSKENQESSNLFIYIDNSFSMDNISKKGRLLDVAKEKGIEILENFNHQNIRIITNNFNSTENLIKNKKESKDYILNIKSSSKNRKTSDILQKVESITSDPYTLFIISDFQKISCNLNDLIDNDSTSKRILIPISKQTNNNISIDTCYLKSPINNSGNSNIICARIKNNSTKNEEDISINLKINDKHKTQQITSLFSNEKKEIELSFTSKDESHLNGVISIEDHPITFDDKLYFSINVSSEIKVCQISDLENSNIKKLYENEDNIVYTHQNIQQLDYNLLNAQNLIILNNILYFSSGLIDFLETYVDNGGSICIIPAKEVDIEHYNLLLQNLKTNLFKSHINSQLNISKINLDHKIFNNVFSTKKLRKDINLPSINQHYSLQNSNRVIKEDIFTFENGDKFLNSYNKQKGEIYLFTSSISEDNSFTKHALFVTTFYNMALQSVSSDKLYYTIDKGDEIKLKTANPNLENIFHIKSENTDIIAEHLIEKRNQYLSSHNLIEQANHYQITQENEFLSYISFNYSRKESNTEQFNERELQNFIKLNNIQNTSIFLSDLNISENLNKLDKDKEYWKLFILLSLIFILIEILLIKKIQS